MAKSVIHNSDYQSVDECTAAIDRYFNKRNQDFLKNPRRAGKKIWGKEK
jgi:ABC-type Na+ transport system ATPase subunit NatA